MQSSTTTDTGHHMAKTHTTHYIQESKAVSPFPTGDRKTLTKTIHKRSTALERSVKLLLEGLNMFDGTNLTLILDVDEDI